MYDLSRLPAHYEDIYVIRGAPLLARIVGRLLKILFFASVGSLIGSRIEAILGWHAGIGWACGFVLGAAGSFWIDISTTVLDVFGARWIIKNPQKKFPDAYISDAKVWPDGVSRRMFVLPLSWSEISKKLGSDLIGMVAIVGAVGAFLLRLYIHPVYLCAATIPIASFKIVDKDFVHILIGWHNWSIPLAGLVGLVVGWLWYQYAKWTLDLGPVD
jgi:hypothetical protein